MFRPLASLLPLALLCACAPQVRPAADTTAHASLATPHASTTPQQAPRNVILVIGDGMGPQQIGLLLQDARAHHEVTAYARFAANGTLALSLTDPADAVVVDSACSATQLATGRPARSEAIGLDVDGNAVPTLVERAHAAGRATGLVSDTRLTHATPAAFAAHQPHRALENEIAAQMLDAGVDVLLSGGARHFLPAPSGNDASTAPSSVTALPDAWRASGRRTDGRDLLHEAQTDGYALAFDRHTLAAVTQPPVLGLFAPSGMQDGIAETWSLGDDARTEPTLAEMTDTALRLLDRAPNGFVLVVEAGQIDWAAHQNDAGRLLHEMQRMDRMLDVVHRYAAARTDTVVVITADHETGGFGLSYQALDQWTTTPWTAGPFAGTPHAPNFRFGTQQLLTNLRAQRRSLEGVLAHQPAQTPTNADGTADAAIALVQAVEAHTPWTLTHQAAADVLSDVPNEWHLEGHPYQHAHTRPAIHDLASFYPYADDARVALLARALAEQQGATWSTGTHTATPVPVVIWGRNAPFASLTTHVEVGAWLASLVGP